MRLLGITLQNFRQFKGTQNLDLRVTAERPVVLVFGSNGAGKTTLLNAFSWAFYGELSKDFEFPERLVNDDLWAETPFNEHVTVAVTVSFEHQNEKYEVRRWCQVRKESNEQTPVVPTLVVRKTTPDGIAQEVVAGQTVIDTILGRKMSRFFFFNGERIEKLVQKGSYAEVKDDVKTLLGLQQVELALKSLPKVERRLGADVKKYGGAQAAAIQEQLDNKREQLGADEDELGRLRGQKSTVVDELKMVEEALRRNADAAPIQEARDRLVKALADSRAALELSVQARRKLVADRGYVAFTAGIDERTSALADALHERGALPAPLKREFVQTLLDNEVCICGTELGPGSGARRHVDDWRERAGLADVEASWQRLSGQVTQLRSARDELRLQLEDLVARVDRDRATVRDQEAELSERNAELERLGDQLADIAELEGKRQELLKQQGDLDYSIRRLDEQLGILRDEIAAQERQLDAAEVKDEFAAKALRRQGAVSNVERALKEILMIREARMSARLDEMVKEVFGQISKKPYEPRLDSEFELGLYKQAGDRMLPVQKSTGETQILSLSFVAAVSKLAREVQAEKARDEELPDDWGEYPIVMDAAFGSLDLAYQREVARALATLAPQLVVLVSKSQGMGEVQKELRNKVNTMAIIVGHSSIPGGSNESIEIDGREYPFFTTGEESTWSEFVEVEA